MNNAIQDIIDILTPEAEKSLYLLSVPLYLSDNLAAGLLVKSGLANGNAPDLVEEIRSFPIWHEKTRNSWGIDDDVREYALSKLNGSAINTRLNVLNAMRDIRKNPEQLSPSANLREFDLQLARLSLTVKQEQKTGIDALRQFFETNHDETTRVVDLYIDESLPATIPPEKILPDYLQSAYFMRGMYAYRNKNFKAAVRFMEPVWKQRSGSHQSIKDAAIAAHVAGLIWSKEQRHEEAEDAYRKSLELGKNDSHHQAQVYHSLGNLLSRNRQRHKEAEEAYLKSIELREANDQFGQAQVYHSLGNLLSRNHQRHKEAEDAYRKSLELLKQLNDQFGQAQVYHSLGNLLSRNHQRHEEAEDAYRKSLELLKQLNDQFGQAQVYHSLGNLLSRDRQRHKEAEDAYLKSLELGKSDSHHLAQVYHSLGNLLSRNRQRHKEAEEAYLKSLELGKNDSHHQAQAYNSLGNLLSEDKNRWQEAEKIYLRCFDLENKNNSHRGIAMVSTSYGSLLIKEGDYDNAEKYLNIALANENKAFYRKKILAMLVDIKK